MTQQDISSKAGFVAVIGRPNAGKSTLINSLIEEKLAMVSHKANATRKRQQIILMYENTQIVLVDTPGLQNRSGELNRFMLKEATKALEESDLIIFVADMADKVDLYKEFLDLIGNRKHIVILTKMDNFTHEQRVKKLAEYQPFQDKFLSIIPISAKSSDFGALIKEIASHMPTSPWYYDPEDLTTESIKSITKELIRESLFENLSDELPYESEVTLDRFVEKKNLVYIDATIIVERESQKGMVIGKGGATIKRIGKTAREKIEEFLQTKCYLELTVKVVANWSVDKNALKKLGYEVEA